MIKQTKMLSILFFYCFFLFQPDDDYRRENAGLSRRRYSRWAFVY